MPRRTPDPFGFQARLDALSPEDLSALTKTLVTRFGVADPFSPPPSRLRPPLDTVHTYRVRVSIDRTSPPVWRRLELASDLHLDVVHDVIQVAIGWTDSHLHQFRSGKNAHDPHAEVYLNAFDIEEGEEGTPEAAVRLDQVLREVGDRLFYTYDFGDDWDHTIKLEAVLPARQDAPRAVCSAGRRAGPPEDVGGVWGYAELLAALANPGSGDPDVVDSLLWLGPGFDPAVFDADEVNTLLGVTTGRRRAADLPADLPPAILDLLERTREPGRRLLVDLVARAGLDEHTEVSPESTARMVRPYTWLLDRVGTEGIPLTQAGYLPPAVVEEAAAQLGLSGEWIGTLNRESQTYPLLEFRESARQVGLLRKSKGRLLLTAKGKALRDKPLDLARHVADRLPLGRDDCERQAGMVTLLLVAANGNESPDVDGTQGVVVTILSSIGWMGADGMPFDRWMAAEAARPTSAVLTRIGVLPTSDLSGSEPTPHGRAFARTALRHAAVAVRTS